MTVRYPGTTGSDKEMTISDLRNGNEWKLLEIPGTTRSDQEITESNDKSGIDQE